jgi:hypothetical protein
VSEDEGDEDGAGEPTQASTGEPLAPCSLREGISEDDVRERFCQAVRDLAHVGALKNSNRRSGDGFVQRLLLELVAWN